MPSSQAFQSQVNVVQAPGIAGDFCSSNPRFSYLAGPGALVAGTAGLTVGRFAWVNYSGIDGDNAPGVANNFGPGPVAGFVHREKQALITAFLTEAGNVIPPGFDITLMSGGDFWVKNDGATQALPGMKAYANFADGTVTFSITGAPLTGSASGSIGPAPAGFTASINGNVLTVSAVSSGVLVPGMTVGGTAGVAAATKITAQLTGSVGAVGTYALNIPEQSVVSSAMSGTVGLLTVSGTVSGVLGVGSIITGTGVTVGTTITALGTGTGGAGTYYVDPSQTASLINITWTRNVETKWVCFSAGLAGELVKISSQPAG